MNLAFLCSGKQYDRVVHGARKPKVFRPWQIRQWLGLDIKTGKPRTKDGKPLEIPASLQTRQRKRAAFRALAHKEIAEKYGPEPRHARRGIALVLARRAYREHEQLAPPKRRKL